MVVGKVAPRGSSAAFDRTRRGATAGSALKKKFAAKSAGGFKGKGGLKKRRVNLSRKQIMKAKQDQAYEEKEQRRSERKTKKKQATAGFTHLQNKRNNKVFDHSFLKTVNDGIVESIESFGEKPSPTSMFFCIFTHLENNPPEHHIPYLLAILTALCSKVSNGVLMSRMGHIVKAVEEALSKPDNLAAAKALKLIQEVCVVAQPTTKLMDILKKLEPNKLNAALMGAYIATIRKFLQNAFITGHVDFFMESLPEFVETCVNNFTETKTQVAQSTKKELLYLFSKTLTPKAIQYGASVINETITLLTSVYKAHFKDHWGIVAEVVTGLFEKLSFVKRMPETPRLTETLPAAAFLLRVLDKIRQVEDASLNPPVTKAITAMASCMRVEELLSILPFYPKEEEVAAFSSGHGRRNDSNTDPWARSYLLNIIRQTAHHDSISFYVEEFIPRILETHKLIEELHATGRLPEAQQWVALEMQYWRCAVGFCTFPTEISNDSFRTLAKHLVGLLKTDLVDTAASALDRICAGFHKLASTEEDEDLAMFEKEEVEGEKGQMGNGGDEDDGLNFADEDEEYLARNEDGWNLHVYHGISQENAQLGCDILAKYSKNIMPQLCNIAEEHPTTAVMDAISSYSKVCAPAVMSTILQGILDLGSNISQFPEDNQEELSSKRRVILDIACAIAQQLSQEHLQSVYNEIVEPVLSDTSLQNRLLQKKAYKLLFTLFETRLKDILPFIPRIVNLLSIGRDHVTVSGLKMRVKCLSWALDAYKIYQPDQIFAFTKSVLPEVILFSRERSGDARELSMDILDRMQRYCQQSAGAAPNSLINIAVAGLGGKSPMLVAATIVALAKLVWVNQDGLRQEELSKLNNIIAGLLLHPNTEVRTASATFLRMMTKVGHKNAKVSKAVYESLPKVAEGVAVVTSQSMVSSGSRNIMRVLLERVIKLFGFEEVEKVFPEGSKRFLQYVNKILRRAEKKEERERNYEAKYGNREDENADQFGRYFMGGMRAGDEDAEGISDLLNDGALKNFVVEKSALPYGGIGNSKRRGMDGDDDEDDPHEALCLVQDEGGKMRIISKAEKKKEDEVRRRRELADQLLKRGGRAGGPSIAARDLLRDAEDHSQNKRKRDDVTDFENEELVRKHGGDQDAGFADKHTAALGAGAKKPTAAQALLAKRRSEKAELREEKRKRMEADLKTGEEYATEKGFGDVKRGNVDPHAYVPLNKKFLNKRNKNFAEKRLDAVVPKLYKGEKAKQAAEKGGK